ncbi:hypothetical protein TNCV_1175411 [Trichonephila clavipes]|nr:hypothetical protein TNCV_1175411 [Trichonephila clavipes]
MPEVTEAIERLITWFKQRRKSGSISDKWGSQLHRVAVALHLANESTFSPGSTIGQEIRYELNIQMLRCLSKENKMSSQKLALYIHAMMAACMDPRDFFGKNLVLELRKRTVENANYTSPFQILVLCNAGDTMTSKDVEKVTSAFNSQHRPFWTVMWQTRTEWNEVVSDGFFTIGMMTQQTAPWENWHLERGFELLRTFGLVRWGLGGSGHIEGTGEKLSFASQTAR